MTCDFTWWIFTIVGVAVLWRFRKLVILTRSTMKTELVSLDTASMEAEWLTELSLDLSLAQKPITDDSYAL